MLCEIGEEEWPILYVQLPRVHSNLIHRKCQQSNVITGIHLDVNSGNRFIMLHVQHNNGFVPNSQPIDKAGYMTSDHGHEDSKFGELCKPNTDSQLSITYSNCFQQCSHYCIKDIRISFFLCFPSQSVYNNNNNIY
jgi:hypothetical protein